MADEAGSRYLRLSRRSDVLTGTLARMPLRKIFVGLAGVALAAVLVFASVRLFHAAIGPSVRGVSAERLSQSGIVMLNPFPWDPPQVTQSQAEQTALKQAPGGTVLQAIMAEVVFTNPSSTKPRLCWVMSMPGSLVVSHGPQGSRRRTANWYIILIDAHSGEFVQGSAGD